MGFNFFKCENDQSSHLHLNLIAISAVSPGYRALLTGQMCQIQEHLKTLCAC